MYRRCVFVLLALLTAALPFAAPAACARALREGLALCGGPLLLSLFPFLIVSTLLARSGGGELLGAPLRPMARLAGARAPCAGGVLLMGLVGGFAPAANAAAQAVRSGRLSARERKIMEMRFGLNGEQEHTQKEVADSIGISQSYISRLEKRIMKRLRREMEAVV